MQTQAVTEHEDGKQHNTINGDLQKSHVEEVEVVDSQNKELSREQSHKHHEDMDGEQDRNMTGKDTSRKDKGAVNEMKMDKKPVS
ncbi:hypothetical protein PG996_001995 [Apiospora saccharicola]|uniref:Allergen n=1 Tax=Apiospora saccharicola TaxID=335842 RepID=A0ABR1WI74_9PEZI